MGGRIKTFCSCRLFNNCRDFLYLSETLKETEVTQTIFLTIALLIGFFAGHIHWKDYDGELYFVCYSWPSGTSSHTEDTNHYHIGSGSDVAEASFNTMTGVLEVSGSKYKSTVKDGVIDWEVFNDR